MLCFLSPVYQLVKLCSGMIEAGRVYVSANKLFVNGIRDLSHHCKKEEMISVSFPDKYLFLNDPSQMTQITVRPS